MQCVCFYGGTAISIVAMQCVSFYGWTVISMVAMQCVFLWREGDINCSDAMRVFMAEQRYQL
jgi:hypothetical protein